MSDDDRRGGAYAPPPDDYDTFDARDAEQDRRGWLFLAAAAVVFALFVAVVYNTFQLGVRERSDSPVITADTEPYRVAPEEGDGAQPDLGVHSLRSGERSGAGGEGDGGQARPVSEEPIELPGVRVETADADDLAGGGTGDDQAQDDMPGEASSQEAASGPEVSPGQEEDRSIEAIIAARERDQAEEPAGDSAGGAAEEPAREPARQTAEARDTDAVARAGDIADQPYLAQIAAFRSREDALADWRRFTRAYPELATGRSADVQRADLGERGIYHRLRINGFETREAANAYCQQLQALGQACLVARR